MHIYLLKTWFETRACILMVFVLLFKRLGSGHFDKEIKNTLAYVRDQIYIIQSWGELTQ